MAKLSLFLWVQIGADISISVGLEGLPVREGGDIGLFIILVPKVL